MRTDALAAVLRPLRAHVERVAARADAQARTAGLTVEAGPGGLRRYRDPRLDQLGTHRAIRPAATRPHAEVRAALPARAPAWSAPTLTVSACLAATGWSR